jgi:Tol biopolymer transport system component
MGKRAPFLCLVTAVTAVAAAAPAFATYGGRNGLLVYQQQAGPHVQLFTAKPDGSQARQLTEFPDSDAVAAAWSPDGTKIAFMRYWAQQGSRGERWHLYTMNADGTGQRDFGRKLRGSPAWLPDSRHLLTGRSLRYVILDSATGGLRDAGIPGVGVTNSPCFLGKGGSVAFLAERVKPTSGRAIFVGRLGGGAGSLKRITPWEPIADKIDCSPDGTRVAFSTPEFGPPQSANVYTIGVDGTGLQQLTHNRGGKINNGLDSFSPDGKKIAFVSNRGGTYQIYSMNADGTEVTQITRDAEAHLAAWGTHA